MTTLEEKIAVMQAAAAGKGIQFRPVHSQNIWREAPEPTWDWHNWEYRVAKTKKTGWINIYKNEHQTAGRVYQTKADADFNQITGRVACIQIEWKEE